jgi:hypothetical protein
MKNKNLFFLSFLIFLAVMAGMLWSEKQATCGSTIIIPLELTTSITEFKALLIDGCQLHWIERNTYLDFLFLITYTATLFFALRTLIEDLKMADVFMPLVWLVVLPALFDAVENVLLIKFLYAPADTVSHAAFSVYYWCVHIKFTLLILTLLTLLALFINMVYAKMVGKKV